MRIFRDPRFLKVEINFPSRDFLWEPRSTFPVVFMSQFGWFHSGCIRIFRVISRILICAHLSHSRVGRSVVFLGSTYFLKKNKKMYLSWENSYLPCDSWEIYLALTVCCHFPRVPPQQICWIDVSSKIFVQNVIRGCKWFSWGKNQIKTFLDRKTRDNQSLKINTFWETSSYLDAKIMY